MAGPTLDLGNLLIHLNMSTVQYLSAMKMAEGKLIAFSNKMTVIGRQLSLRVTLPLLLIGAGATKAFASFDDAMTKSLAIMNGITPVIRKEMEELATVMSDQTITSATDLAKSYFFLASAGFDVEQSMASLNAVNQFAIAGNFDMALATDLATDAQSALGLTVKDAQKNLENMTRVTDVLVGANTLANATVQQFSESLTGQAGPAMKAYGIEIEAGVAALAAYADQGIKGAKASSMFSRFLRLSVNGALENTAAWEKFNISIFDVSEKLKPLDVIIRDLSTVLGNMTPKMQFATLNLLGFKARAQQAILPLLGLQDRIKKYNEELVAMGGKTDEVANKNMASFSAQMAIVRNQVVNAGRDIGRILAPSVLALGEKLKVASRAWKDLSEETKEMIVRIGLFAAAAGPALLIVSALTKMIITLSMSFVGLSAAMFGPLGIALLLAAVAFTLRAAWVQNFEFILGTVQDFFDNFKEGFDWLLTSGVPDTVVAFAEFWIDTFKFIKTNFRSFVGDLVGTLVGTASFIRTLGASIHDAIFLGLNFEEGVKKLREGISDAKEAFSFGFLDAANEATVKWDAFVESVKSGTETAGIVLKAFGMAGVEHLGALMDTLKVQFNQDANAVIALIKSKLSSLEKDSNAASKNILKKTIAELTEKFKGLEKILKGITVEEQRLQQPLTEWAEHAADTALRVNEVWASMFDNMGTQLADFLLEGKANFHDFAKSVIRDLLAIALRAQVILPIARGLKLIPAAVSSIPVAAGPPVPVGLASGGIVTRPTLAMIGEGGQDEAVIPLSNGSVPVRFSGGRQEAPTIIINNKTGENFKQEGVPTFDGKAWIIGIVTDDINGFGSLRQTIKGIGQNG